MKLKKKMKHYFYYLKKKKIETKIRSKKKFDKSYNNITLI